MLFILSFLKAGIYIISEISKYFPQIYSQVDLLIVPDESWKFPAEVAFSCNNEQVFHYIVTTLDRKTIPSSMDAQFATAMHRICKESLENCQK